MIDIYYVVCCILCTRTEINELLTTFCYVFNNNTTWEIIYNHSNLLHAAGCPKFRTVKKKIYYGLNFEKKKICVFLGP